MGQIRALSILVLPGSIFYTGVVSFFIKPHCVCVPLVDKEAHAFTWLLWVILTSLGVCVSCGVLTWISLCMCPGVD